MRKAIEPGEYNMKKVLIVSMVVFLLVVCSGCVKKEITLSIRKYNRIAKEIQANAELIQKGIEEITKLQDDETTFIYINRSIIRKETLKGEEEQQNTNETLVQLFINIWGLNGITVEHDRIDFGGWGRLLTSSIGFCYCPSDTLTIEDLMGTNSAGKTSLIDNDTYYWREHGGNNEAFIRRIEPNYYYYEIWW